MYIQPIAIKTRKRKRKTRAKKVKDISEWAVPKWRAPLQGKEFIDDDGVRRVIADVVFSHEDVYYGKYILKGEKDIKKNHDYTILRQVFGMARDGRDD